MRDECLNRELLETPLEARVVRSDWRNVYNLARTYGNIDAQTPAEMSSKVVPQARFPIGKQVRGHISESRDTREGRK